MLGFQTVASKIRLVLLVVLLLIVGWVGLYYAADRPLEADVVDKRCSALGPSEVVVKTRLFGVRHTSPVDAMSCGAVPVGAFVLYHVRSGHTVVYEIEGGRCIWDSAGPCR